MKTREQVPLDLLDANPWQPRQAMDPEALQGLADDIGRRGLLQAPLGRRVQDGRVQLAFGHRRAAAFRLLERQAGSSWAAIEMDLDDLTDEEMAVNALAENEEREQLTQIEAARAHRRAIDETSLSVQGLARQLGMPRSTLSNNLRVLELPELVLEHVESGDLGMTVAREFLVLQNGGHAHVADMERVVRDITGMGGRSGAPDWRRSYVRSVISDRVASNEADWRPLGPRLEMHHYAPPGANRECGFDVEMFSAEHPDTLHTIPAYQGAKYEASRVWTCAVKQWRGWQTRATREANREAEASGKPAPRAANTPSRDQQLEELLRGDPVWKKAAVSRGTPGPARPVTAEEREALGTRAEFQDVTHSTPFWKVLERGNDRQTAQWDQEKGGPVPPYFPDLKECQRCTIGAAYAKSRGGYPLNSGKLVCLNRGHYMEKLEAGASAYRDKLDERKKGEHRLDREAMQSLIPHVGTLPEEALQGLARALLAATDTLEWEHPFGEYHQDWSWESGAATKARELLGVELVDGWRGRNVYLHRVGVLGSLPKLDRGDTLELLAALTVYHARRAGELEIGAAADNAQ